MTQIDKVLEKICRTALFIFFMLMVASAFIQVVLRTLFNNPLTWTEELCRYSMVWLTMIGSALAVKYSSHIAVDILKTAISPRAIRIIDKLNYVLIAVFALVLIYYGIILCSRNMSQITPGLKLPMGLVYGAMPVGGIIMLFNVFMGLCGLGQKEDTPCQ